MEESGITTDTERFYTSELNFWDKWLAYFLLIFQVTNFQASQGKDFHQKLDVTDDSKMIIYLYTADLGLPSSAS